MKQFYQLFYTKVGCHDGSNAEWRYSTLLNWLINLALLIIILTLAGCFQVVAQPAPPQYARNIGVEPMTVQPGTLVVVRGTDWEPNEELLIDLSSLPFEPTTNGTFAAATADDKGAFAVSFYYPQTSPWNALEAAKLTVQSLESEESMSLILTVMPPPTSAAPATATATPTVAATSLPPDGDDVARVTAPVLNVRQGPSTDYPIYTVVEQGEGLHVLGQNVDGTWLRVRLNNGREGWVLRSLTNFIRAVVVVPAPPLVITPTPAIMDWRGEYFDNRTLGGSPRLVRNDSSINFDWGFGAPSDRLPTDGFSIRWTRTLSFAGGTFRFFVRADDGARVWLDNTLIIDQWREQSAQTLTADVVLNAGAHHLRVEYFEGGARAEMALWWERVGDFPQWNGEYFNNTGLAGQPLVVRNDADLNFDWQQGSPATGISVDNFSARWMRSPHFSPGLYRFHARMDDGLRLYVDGNLVIDQWRDGGVREAATDIVLAEGTHALRVEYYERFGNAAARVWWEKLDAPNTFSDWKGEYWRNRDLSGNPAFVRNDRNINFNWGSGSPAEGIPTQNFSARWTRRLNFDSGTYRFHATADDGVRVWVDGQILIDEWRDSTSREVIVDRLIAAGSHDLRVDYYESQGGAMINVWWERIQTPGDFPDWKGEYWSNQELRGTPAVIRNDAAVDFSWGGGSPAGGIPTDHFSARWTRQVRFERGLYRFYLRADDGVRLFIDDGNVIDEWHDSRGNDVYTVEKLMDGQHRLRVEYFENTAAARVEFWWQRLADPTPTSTPTSTGTSTGTSTPTSLPTESNTPVSTATVPTATVTPSATETPIVTETPTVLPPTDLPPTEAPTLTPTPVTDSTVTPTATICPQVTPEPLWVDPLSSPTNVLTQTVLVYLGGGEAVTVTTESGVFSVSGDFDATTNPAQVEISLLPNTTHNLTVSGRVQEGSANGCVYGGYTLSTQLDRTGQPLTIIQQSP